VSLRSSFCVPLIRALSQQRSRACRVYLYQYIVGAQSALRGQLEPHSRPPRATCGGGLPLPYVRALDEALKEAV
jgi:hypothetical protein